MNPCEAFRDALIDLHYGLLESGPEADRIRRHLVVCPACAQEHERLELLTGSLRGGEAFPLEGSVDWGRFARETVARAVAPAAATGWAAAPRRGLRLVPSWASGSLRLPAARAWAAAASLVLVASVAMVLYGTLPSREPRVADAGVHMSQRGIENLTVNLARTNTARYLNETRAVLLTLMDLEIGCDVDKVDITAERAKAVELLRRQRLIATELNRLPLARAEDVCNDLERLLVEISSLADCTRDDEIRTLRDVVERKQILVRMELVSQELERRGADV